MKLLKPSIAVLLCVVLCVFCVCPVSAAPRPLFGDANDDGTVNMKDVLTLRSYLADIPVSLHELYADANGDSDINMKDVLLLRKYMADIPVKFGELSDPLDLLLCDGEDAAITLYDVRPDGKYGFELLLGAENLTYDRSIEVTLVGAALNDKAILPLWTVKLSPFESAVDTAIFALDNEFSKDVKKIGLWVLTTDAETGEILDTGSEVTEVTLGGSIGYQKEDRAPTEGCLLIDNGEIRAISTGFKENETSLNTYIENRTDKPLMYLCDHAVVNDVDISALWIGSLLPGADMEAGLILDADELQAAGITDIETVEFAIDAYDSASLNDPEPTPLHSYNVMYYEL